MLHSNTTYSKMNEMRCSSHQAPYLCQSSPHHTGTVCLHPLGSQRTSTQWEFHRALFLLPLLLCRKQTAFCAHSSFGNKCLLMHVSPRLKNSSAHIWQVQNGCKMQSEWLVCSSRPVKARLWFFFTCLALHLWACCERSPSPLFAGNTGCRRRCQR